MVKFMQALAGLRFKKRPSLYNKLDKSRQEIRLLRLLPKAPQIPGDDSDDEILRCEMRVVSLQDEPVYECISYCWGDAAVTKPILINGNKLQITTNLEHALRYFRSEDAETVWLWADAICIQQDSIDECNSQVALMKEIFSKAQRVRAWVKTPDKLDGPGEEGPAGKAESLGAGFSILLLPDQPPEKLLARGNLAHVREVAKLFENDYWKRVWILQELAVAKRFHLYYGRFTMVVDETEWASGCWNGCRRFLEIVHIFRNQQRQARLHPDKYPFLWDETLMPITEYGELLTMLSSIVINLTSLGVAEQLANTATFDPVYHLLSLRGRQSSRKHDCIYGLLGLAPKGMNFKPDYRHSWEVTAMNFTYAYISGMQSLSPICLAMSREPDLPSWVVDMASQEPAEKGPVLVSTLYNAAGASKFRIRYGGRRTVILPGILFQPIRNIAFNGASVTITLPDVEGTPQLKVSPELFWTLNCMRLYHSYTAQDGPVPDFHGFDIRALTSFIPSSKHYPTNEALRNAGIQPAVLRTMLYDTNSSFDADNATSLPRRLDAAALARYKADVDDALRTDTFTHYEACRLLCMHAQDCSFFMTCDGRAGLANKHIEAGDMICIISSFSIPFVVRAYAVNKTGEKLYKFISQCYVDGLMDGEACKTAANGAGGNAGSIDALFTDMRFI